MANKYKWFEIPLTPNAQSFFISLGAKRYQLTVMYRNCTEGGWFLDIADDQGVPIVMGIPLVCGVDLLAAYPDKNFGGVLLVSTDAARYAPPTFTNLGTQSHLYFGVLQ